ncbi:MAG: DUF115 domain-containing protein, partial [Candidatus Omnitrophica bacterium]|nr:DUF115 domain-containing protein [Candidatus Omnitrophota bacterium]
MKLSATQSFDTLINQISEIGLKRHAKDLIEHAQTNLSFMKQTVKDVPLPQGEKAKSGIIISAGPSVKRQKSIQRILDAGYKGTVIAVDGAFIACLKAGLSPDYVLTLDPHKTRIVRWFGDHNFEEHTRHDDYFTRQDLDVDFRKNSIEHNEKNIELVNEKGRLTKAIISTSSPKNVVQRLQEANVNMYWWNP